MDVFRRLFSVINKHMHLLTHMKACRHTHVHKHTQHIDMYTYIHTQAHKASTCTHM